MTKQMLDQVLEQDLEMVPSFGLTKCLRHGFNPVPSRPYDRPYADADVDDPYPFSTDFSSLNGKTSFSLLSSCRGRARVTVGVAA